MPSVIAFDTLRVVMIITQAEANQLQSLPVGGQLSVDGVVQGAGNAPMRQIKVTVEKQ
jgi:hypothetical protein